MLVLTRRVGEVLSIGDDVKMTVVGIRGNQIRIGIEAPREIAIKRHESLPRFDNGESA